MKKRYLIAFLIIYLLCSGFLFFKRSKFVWKMIGPGEADQVSSLSITKKGMLYVGTDVGGVYKSEDDGSSWSPINNGIKNYYITTQVLADPENGLTLYVGTRGGFYKSINGGNSWEAKWEGLAKGAPSYHQIISYIGAIAIDPNNPNILYAGLSYKGRTPDPNNKWAGNLYRSTDKGESWKLLYAFGSGIKINDIEFVTSKIILVGTGAGLYKSAEAGDLWDNIFKLPVRSVTIVPDKIKIIYLSAGEKGIFKSVDSGMTWKDINDGLVLTKDRWFLTERDDTPSFSDDYSQVAVNKDNPEHIYTINTTWGDGGGVYKSENAGDSWRKIVIWDNIFFSRNIEVAWLDPSNRVNAIILDPYTDKKIFIGTSRYIYKSQDDGKSWSQLVSQKVTEDTWTHRGLNVFGQTRVVGVDPNDGKNLYIGTADHGLLKSTDEGKSWKLSMNGMEYKGNIYDIVVDKKDSKNIFTINGNVGFNVAGFAKSTDFGDSWQQLNTGLAQTLYFSILVDYENKDTLYLGGKDGVYKTENGGKKWIWQGLKDTVVRKIIFHPKDSNIIFAATNNGLFKSRDRGSIWNKLHTGDMDLYSIVINPDKPDIIYVAGASDGARNVKGGVYKSLNGGKVFTEVLKARRIDSLAMMPENPDILYAASNDDNYHDESSGEGVFRTADAGDTWEGINDGLSVLRGYHITISPKPPYKVYWASNGSGVYVGLDN